MKVTKKAVLSAGTTGVRKAVAKWVADKMGDYQTGAAGVLGDLFHGGCQSGIVSSLVYTKDTCAFYQKNKEEIWDLVIAQAEEAGFNPLGYLGANCKGAGDIGNVDQFENFMAWLAFEETARIIAAELEIEA